MKKVTLWIIAVTTMLSLPCISIKAAKVNKIPGLVVEDTTIMNLSLKEAQDYAVNHNRSLENADLDIKKAEAAHWQAIATMLPQVSAKVDYSNMCGYEMDFSGQTISMPPSGQIVASSSISISGAQVVNVQVAKISERMADVTKKKSEKETRDNIKLLYYTALVTTKTVSLLEENLKSLEDLLRFSNKSVEMGVSEQVDADQIMVQVSSMKSSINSTKRSLEAVYNSIRLQLDLDVNKKIKLTQTIDDLLNVDTALSLLTSDFIVNDNYSYQLSEQSAEISRKKVDIAKWSFAPSLTLGYSYTKKKYFSDEPTFNMTPPNMISMSISIPIFSSGSRNQALKSAQYDYQKSVNTLIDTEKSLEMQYRQLCYNLNSSFEKYQIQKENVDVTQRLFNNMAKKYEYGTASGVDITTSGTNVIQAQNTYIQSLLDFVNSQIQLETLLNK